MIKSRYVVRGQLTNRFADCFEEALLYARRLHDDEKERPVLIVDTEPQGNAGAYMPWRYRYIGGAREVEAVGYMSIPDLIL